MHNALSSLFYICMFFNGCSIEVVTKAENTCSPFQRGAIGDQAKSQLCPPVRAGRRGDGDSAFSTPCSTSAAGLHLAKIAFRKRSYRIPGSSQGKLLCSSLRYMPVHQPFQRLCQNGPTTHWSPFPPPKKSPLGKEVTCCNLYAAQSIYQHSICWFTQVALLVPPSKSY